MFKLHARVNQPERATKLIKVNRRARKESFGHTWKSVWLRMSYCFELTINKHMPIIGYIIE